MTTDPDALTEAELESLSGFIGINAYYAENCTHLFETVESILSARAAALRADVARDLVERLNKANRQIEELDGLGPDIGDQCRLRGKAEGVRLARSYVEEMLR